MRHVLISALLATLALGAGTVQAIDLSSITFPEGRTVDGSLEPLPGAAAGRIQTEVTFRNAQSRIEVEYADLKPAILFAGDVTCYVMWAISRDGQAENLGEFLVDEPKGRLEFLTGKKAFALMVTAEPFYLVSQPSSLVVYKSAPSRSKKVSSTLFEFGGLGSSPRPKLDSITDISWDSNTALQLLQARKAFELATANDASLHAPQIYQEARSALNEANELETKSSKSRKLLDAARRSVAMSNEAMNISMRRKEGIEIEKQITRRRAEMQSLEQRAVESEEMVAAARADMQQLGEEKERMAQQTAMLREETRTLESSMDMLRQEKQSLETAKARLTQEKSELSDRLAGALSHVAETRNTARGYVVNLPDILFDVNQASLKTATQPVLAKLAGILLVISDLKVKVEGHTDSTGSEQYNLDLSRRRAEAVMDFIGGQGVEASRLNSEGFGMTQPVSPNDSAEGRSRNRRVEIVISEK